MLTLLGPLPPLLVFAKGPIFLFFVCFLFVLKAPLRVWDKTRVIGFLHYDISWEFSTHCYHLYSQPLKGCTWKMLYTPCWDHKTGEVMLILLQYNFTFTLWKQGLNHFKLDHFISIIIFTYSVFEAREWLYFQVFVCIFSCFYI